MSVDETSQRQLVGSFIFPYVEYILKSVPMQGQISEESLKALTAKVTGMVIQIPSFPQMMMATRSIDDLALKTREAVSLIQAAETATARLNQEA